MSSCTLSIYITADEDAIIQPMATSFDDGEEIFQLPQKYRMAMNKKSTYEEYCRVSKPMYDYTAYYKNVLIMHHFMRHFMQCSSMWYNIFCI